MEKLEAMKSRFPFTESQREELEQQGQIFKYIVSGLPVPHHLLYPIRRSSYFSTPTFPSKLLSRPSPHLSWNVYEMGLGRKIDPEPGRCRRTDGKKWRCSKEVYPDSKYCERHMHRGKNRSRKPVESSKSSTRPILSSSLSLNNDSDLSSSVFYNTSASKPLHGLALYGHRDSPGSFPSYMDQSDHYRRSRYMNEIGGSLFQMEPSSSVGGFSGSSMEQDSSWGFTPLTINPSSNLYDPEKQEKVKEDRHCYLLGTEVKQQMPFSFLNHQEEEEEEEEEEPSKKPVHRFFDEWPQHHREVSSNSSSVSTTLFI